MLADLYLPLLVSTFEQPVQKSGPMKITFTIHLKPTDKERTRLLDTMKEFADACNEVSIYAWKHKMLKNQPLYDKFYGHIIQSYKLATQVASRVVSKVAKSYRIDKKKLKVFDDHSAIIYSRHSLEYYPEKSYISIWTLEGRQHIAYEENRKIKDFLPHQRGDSYLVYSQDEFYLIVHCEVLDTEPYFEKIVSLST